MIYLKFVGFYKSHFCYYPSESKALWVELDYNLLRGGSWYDNAKVIRSALRNTYNLANRYVNGFRLVLSF